MPPSFLFLFLHQKSFHFFPSFFLKQLQEIQDFFLMGIEDKQRQWQQKSSLLEAIGSFVHLEKNNQVSEKRAKTASGILI